ncbi:MAG: glycosyltransferase family 1 protein [Rhodospirillales bacterium]|nr:glycosyltransferase family 1 protein [Rhodospirillales bacterium]
MNVVYDLVFFAKEPFGGISRMWMELFRRIPGSPVDPAFIVGPSDNLAQKYLESQRYLGGRVEHEPRVGFFGKLALLGAWRSLKLLTLNRRVGADIFHSTDYINPLVTWGSIKIVTTIHDMVFWDQADRFTKNIWFWDKRWSTYHALRVSDRVVTVSEASRDRIVARFPWAARKIAVIPHGLDDSFRRVAIRQTKDKRFLFIGSRNCYKNFDLLVDAFARFSRDLPDWTLHVVGENASSRAGEAELYRRLGISDKIVDHGLIGQADLVDLMSRVGAIVIPSLNEGFNFPLLEAMGAGAPVVSSDIPASRELGEGHVRFFPMHSVDSLVTALRDVAERPPSTAQLLAAQAHARSFTWDRSFTRLVEVYESVLSGKAA